LIRKEFNRKDKLTMNMDKIQTPWGRSEGSKKIGEGIIFYCTPSHGGFKVEDQLNQYVPVQWRLGGRFDGWYEEDCGWAPLALTFPEYFTEKQCLDAQQMITLWESWVKRFRP